MNTYEDTPHYINRKYTENSELQQIICNLLQSATFCLMSDGHIHREKFRESAKDTIKELERLINPNPMEQTERRN